MSASPAAVAVPNELPPAVRQLLVDLVESARQCLQDDLRSIVLFGSGAEARLRATSDLNLLFVLTRFDKQRIDALREPLRLANVAARASVMFVLEAELPEAAEAFAVKFDDIGRRRRVLYGEDPIARLNVSRESKRVRLRQILMNLTLRLRSQYATAGLHEEQLATIIAEAAGPLRSAAATLLELEGQTVASPRQALESIVAGLPGGDGPQTLHAISEARNSRRLPPGVAGPLMFRLMALAEELDRRAERIR
jgi:hypothetical protein